MAISRSRSSTTRARSSGCTRCRNSAKVCVPTLSSRPWMRRLLARPGRWCRWAGPTPRCPARPAPLPRPGCARAPPARPRPGGARSRRARCPPGATGRRRGRGCAAPARTASAAARRQGDHAVRGRGHVAGLADGRGDGVLLDARAVIGVHVRQEVRRRWAGGVSSPWMRSCSPAQAMSRPPISGRSLILPPGRSARRPALLLTLDSGRRMMVTGSD